MASVLIPLATARVEISAATTAAAKKRGAKKPATTAAEAAEAAAAAAATTRAATAVSQGTTKAFVEVTTFVEATFAKGTTASRSSVFLLRKRTISCVRRY